MNRSRFNNAFFTNKELYDQLDDETKQQHFFMFNRCMARLSPINADALNSKSIKDGLAMDIWSIFSKSLLKQPPNFEPEWYKFKKTKSMLDGFNKLEQKILTTYYDHTIDEITKDKEKEKQIGKIEKKKK